MRKDELEITQDQVDRYLYERNLVAVDEMMDKLNEMATNMQKEREN